MYAVQTQFSVVICHLGVTYVQRADDLSYPLPADHWKQCTLDTCLPVGTKVSQDNSFRQHVLDIFHLMTIKKMIIVGARAGELLCLGIFYFSAPSLNLG